MGTALSTTASLAAGTSPPAHAAKPAASAVAMRVAKRTWAGAVIR
jgi:hypothetical protein